MAEQSIQEGFEVFAQDGTVAFGAVRQIPYGGSALVIYVENAGEFTVPLSAVKSVHDEKVIFDCGDLDQKLLVAIGHAHDAEDPSIADK